jgi:hypothetical protein
MRTSGSGGGDFFMTAAPLTMLVVFVVWMLGGPAASIELIDSGLRSVLGWVGGLLR